MIYFKANKIVIKLKNNVSKLLKGVSTNTLEANKNAFLDVFGKIIVTSYQIKFDDEVLLIIERQFLERLKKHLEKYLKLTKTIIEETDYKVYAEMQNEKGNDEEKDQEKKEMIIKDKTGAWLITKKILRTITDENDYTMWRVKNNIPLQGVDYDQEMLLNINDNEYISFTKGCYLGQEIIARVHNLAKPPKRLIIKYEDDCTEEEKKRLTSKCLDPKTGKTIGFIFVKNTADDE